MDRRTFLKSTIVAAVLAPLTVNRVNREPSDEEMYQVLRIRLRAMWDCYHKQHGRGPQEIFVGEHAIACYERGLLREHGARNTYEPAMVDHPATRAWQSIVRSKYTASLRFDPHLQPWEIAVVN